MNFLREKQSCRYFLFLLGTGLLLMLAALGLCFLHAAEVQQVLLERERTVTAALLDQGVPGPVLAAALQNTAPSAKGDALLARAGRTEQTPLPLLALPAQSTLRFGGAALGGAALFALAVTAGSALWLRRRERLYQNVIDTVAEYSEGKFQRHLPQNENGTLYQMFGGIEELAMALQSKNESEQASKAFLRDMISDISHQLKTPLAGGDRARRPSCPGRQAQLSFDDRGVRPLPDAVPRVLYAGGKCPRSCPAERLWTRCV